MSRYNYLPPSPEYPPVVFAFLTDLHSPEWADLLVVLGLVVGYALLAIPFPGLMLRPLFWLATRTIYRIHVVGRENVPATGPALLLCNHVTFIDWLLVWRASPRKLRFVAWAGWTKNPVFRWFLRATNSILINGEGGPKQIVKSLREITAALDAGEAICLFPEGALSRGGGVMLPFRRGFERVLRDAKQPVTVVPICLNQLWGSIFSYAKGKVLWKLPVQIPYRVSVSFGKPLPASVTAPDVRLAIQELSAETMIRDSDHLRPVHRQFLRTAARFSNLRRTAWVDASGGKPQELNYLKALVGSMCIRNWLKSRIGTEQNVGIWLPTSAGNAMANVALNFLGRTTVNLNYTAGIEAIRSAVKQTGMRTILTSKKFLARMPLELEGVSIVHLEDALRDITKWQKIKALLAVAILPGWFLEYCVLGLGRHRLDDVVTIIFSSGSTGEPKGVPLTYRNISTNAASAADHMDLVIEDRLLGVLPFFHSFGYMAILWLPLHIGASSVFYPDPRQAKEVGELAKKFKCTGFLGTATFLRFYLRRCQPDDFKTLRLLVCGAEKLPPALAKEFEEKFGILPMEGYGCTELSPAVAINVSDVDVKGIKQIRNKIGTVGHPIPGVACRTFDPDTEQPLPAGGEGLIWVKGPNVMPGYLNRPDLTAKAIKNGWYNTGDVGKIDDDGFITITGRLSRFAKIAGEMVPLEKVEEDMHAVIGTNERVLAVTSIPDEKRGERLVVLFLPALTTPPREIAKGLGERGIPNLWIPGDRDYFEVKELPILGTGKLDLRKVKDLALEAVKS
jgi:acyl-[acyl-carrier-protein]-phospholipid O-acyltransferase/long-chain-fatty-acid--[acyl-carrier-protein] ligase